MRKITRPNRRLISIKIARWRFKHPKNPKITNRQFWECQLFQEFVKLSKFSISVVKTLPPPPTCLESMSQTNFKVANYSDILHSDWFKLLQWPTRERKESNSMNTIWLISFYKLYITYVLAKTTDVYPTHYWSNYCLCEHKRLPISFKSFFKLTPELKQTINF